MRRCCSSFEQNVEETCRDIEIKKVSVTERERARDNECEMIGK